MLRAVASGAYPNLELPTALRAARLTGRDAGFATELTYGTLRLRGRYDPIIAAAAGRPLAAIDDNVLDTLRLGVHQLLGMRVPAHAAVAQTVALARQVNGAGAAGFVNAALRRVSERPLDEWLEIVAGDTAAAIQRLSVRESHPEWIVKALREALLGHGRSTRETVDADLADLLAADNEAAAVSLVARPGWSAVAELTDAGALPGRWAPTAATVPGGDPGTIPAVRQRRAAVQDEGSQLVTLAFAATRVEGSPSAGGPRWLDLCAGPGGKAGLLAALALRDGASLVANEVSKHRAALVRQTLEPAFVAAPKGRIEVRVGDGREIGELEPAAYDRVLVDAPCTGLGALRRRPDSRWRRTPDDLAVLTSLQRELLASAIDATRPGGVIGYVTCSPHLSETVYAVRDVIKRRTDIILLDAADALRDKGGAAIPGAASNGFVQLWPDIHGTDGMFLALLRKRPAPPA